MAGDKNAVRDEFLGSKVQRNPALGISSLFGVKGKVALITGGSRGIGLMAAKALVENGAKVYVSARKADVCEAVAQTLNSLGPGQCFALPADVSTDKACKELAAQLQAKESKLDILMNNAGATWGSSFEDHPESAWGKVMSLNVASIFHLTRACTPMLLAASGGNLNPSHVINIGSVGGEISSVGDNNPAYLTSKAAVAHLTKHLAGYFARKGVVVNNIQPGVFPSKMTFDYQLKTEKGVEMSANMHPVGRVGTEEDMAGLVIFLSSRASAFVTGESINLEGGVANIRNAHLLPPVSKL
eukprot:gnl/TRDRNA2_/TRDRNA2_129804_c0_seq1.p1 gnl/TRDRNA2_/TRDRNA2_129804_c0~~gnl/TRDRNA2_/TRDRNA2_129804_c0_seq1.p1  ORF type:complete len:315 (-),score=65.52 gnl/TRDRNA2_/TRDRNA2_129804_c0_seq1:100-996(-)